MSDPSNSQPPTLAGYLESQAVSRFTAALQDAERRLTAAQQEVQDLRGAVGTACWMVEGEEPQYLNISNGGMRVGASPEHEPFMTMFLPRTSWERLAGGSFEAGFLDGRGTARRFGQSRIQRLRGLKGTVQFSFTALPDGSDWSCNMAFGGSPIEEVKATVSIPFETFQQIQAGQLDPQMAFMQGRVKMGGDAGLVMQLGMAMFM